MSNDEYPYLLGSSRIDITPPIGVTLAGYTPRVATSIEHPLSAEAIYCATRPDSTGDAAEPSSHTSSGDGARPAWLVVAADFIGIRLGDTRELRRRIASKTGVGEGAISIIGTHTHSGPATILANTDEASAVDREYVPRLWDSLVSVAASAVDSAAPAMFEAARGAAPELGSNRRIQLADGTWTNEWQDPSGEHPGYFDPTVMVVGARREDGTLASIIVNYGCHPVTLGPSSLAVSPDYPGYMKDRLRERAGAETVSFLLAGAGNINPRVCVGNDPSVSERLGEALADHVLRIAAEAVPAGSGPVTTTAGDWVFERTRDSYKRAGMAGNRKGDIVRTEVRLHRAGEVALVAVPGELFNEYNAEIRDASPFPFTTVATLANDYIGYIPTNVAQEQGAYETKMAPAERVGDGLMQLVRGLLGRKESTE